VAAKAARAIRDFFIASFSKVKQGSQSFVWRKIAG